MKNSSGNTNHKKEEVWLAVRLSRTRETAAEIANGVGRKDRQFQRRPPSLASTLYR
jgi:hypothetical protein